ncbi:glycosyltransferase family 9 protein [Paraburkholderia sp. EG286B]|uniref:glycosyltransferase family 9 protein n=1 Tax=Paraburkholderia sp. EG286B TaxID=3237011 RepID=UPI0034D1B109
MKIQIQGNVAVALPPPIGDSLIGLVLVNNLIRNGYRPIVFGWVAEQLADWFPHMTVGYQAAYAGAFDTVIELRPTEFGPMLSRTGKTLRLADLPEYGGGKHMVDRIVDIAANVFGLRDVTHSNGLVVPPGVQRGRFADRVVIHPTGSHREKMWSREKFLALADELKCAHLHPGFLVAPGEFAAWRQSTMQGHEVHSLPRLEDVATWIAESAWFIGNDSGLGHLASSIGVPTLTLFMRRGLARTWRPCWGPGQVVLPPNVIPFGNLKELLWTKLLSVRRVMAHFQALQAHS